MQNILVTGATGYLGSHACVELLGAGYGVVAVDNFENSCPEVVARIEELSGRSLDFHELDVRHTSHIEVLLGQNEIEAVIHFAGLKAVGESVVDPLRYYETNVGSTLALIGSMNRAGVKKLVFSSSCTVYGNPPADQVPLTELSDLQAVSPYGRTKLMIEQMLQDVASADPEWRAVSLRYFNPVAAHESGRIGDDARRATTNLLPVIMETAIGRRDKVKIYGGDYDTADGTCIRDYIHVVDLVRAHIKTLSVLDSVHGCEPINLGTGVGSSVLDVIRSAERATGMAIPFEIVGRRGGDAAAVYADAGRALSRLGWKAEYDLDQMSAHAWRWQCQNPDGYSMT